MREASIFTSVSVKNTIFIWLPVFWWESKSLFGFLQFCNYFVPILKSVINVYIFKRTIDGFWASGIRSGFCRQYWELSGNFQKNFKANIAYHTDFLKISLVFLWGDFKFFLKVKLQNSFIFSVFYYSFWMFVRYFFLLRIKCFTVVIRKRTTTVFPMISICY